MGLGGHLTWTALAREIVKKFPHIRVVPINSNNNIVDSKVFYNNPDFTMDVLRDYIFYLNMDLPDTNYVVREDKQRVYWRSDKHIINILCEYYNLPDPDLRCYINFDDKELEEIEHIKKTYNLVDDNYIVMEPNSKVSFSPNKRYPLHKMNNVCNDISKDIKVVQIGDNTNQLMDNAINLTGKTTFRTAIGLIGSSRLFVGIEGGLVHGATAVNTKSVCICSGFIPMKTVCYPYNINIDTSANKHVCGLKSNCSICETDSNNHDENIIIESIRNEIFK